MCTGLKETGFDDGKIRFPAGGDGSDFLYGGENTYILVGEAGTDTLEGGDGNDTLNGGDANDKLYGDHKALSADYTSGGGADSIQGLAMMKYMAESPQIF